MLRVAKNSDRPAISAIRRACIEASSDALGEAPPLDTPSRPIGKAGSIYPNLVFEEEGEILGCASASRFREGSSYRWSVEEELLVSKDARGRGIGRRLLSALLALLRELGYFKVYATIEMPDPAGVALREELGYSTLCQVRDAAFEGESWRSVSLMARALREPVRAYRGSLPLEPIAFPKFAQANPGYLESIIAKSGLERGAGLGL